MISPDLTDPGTLKRFIAKHDLAPKKGLGQHWLFSAKAVDAIIAESRGAGGILEIGPGAGVLTQRATQVATTVAIDLDPRVEGALNESAPAAHFILGDVLRVDLLAILLELDRPRLVMSNLPYYISTAVIERLITCADSIDWAVLMLQREVGERIAAPPGDRRRGAISVETQAAFDVKVVAKVPPGAFLPPPKVESAVLRLDQRAPTRLETHLVRAAFRQPRKTLLNNLLSARYAKPEVETAISQLAIRPDCRPHHLDLDQWTGLGDRLRSPKS